MFGLEKWLSKIFNKDQRAHKGINCDTFMQVFDNLPVNVMLANKEGEILLINKSSEKTLKAIQHLLPIGVDDIVGSSYDVFHKNPAMQRTLLGNPNNLPHSANIQVGEETLDLLVTALYDSNKNYFGPMVTWSVISDKLALEKRTRESKDRLQSTVMGLVGDTGLASEDLSKYVSEVVTASEEMVASISEISNNTTSAASMTKRTVEEANNVSKIMSELEQFSSEVGKIVQVVSDISNQTNLLALNATIEAARAGEAGKGFAVVANEVKELARQTNEATEDIHTKIKAIQDQTAAAIESITTTAKSIESIDQVVNSIASAIEEQTSVTNEIVRSMESANSKVITVSTSIDKIGESVESNIAMMG